MTQVFADGERLDGTGMRPGQLHVPGQLHALPMVRQRPAPSDHAPALPDSFGPALTAGKGVRPARCAGCSAPTLPRQDHETPLCGRCCDRLAGSPSDTGTASGRWRWRWLAGD